MARLICVTVVENIYYRNVMPERRLTNLYTLVAINLKCVNESAQDLIVVQVTGNQMVFKLFPLSIARIDDTIRTKQNILEIGACLVYFKTALYLESSHLDLYGSCHLFSAIFQCGIQILF